jgi:hypothetical protein
MELENESHPLVSKTMEATFVEASDVGTVDFDATGCRKIERAEEVKERALPASRTTRDRNEFAVVDLKI